MIKKCLGCGSIMQYEDKEKEGYIKEEEYSSSLICRRCFRMKHYGEFYYMDIKNDTFIDILNSINNTNDLVLYVVDIFTINDNIENINNYLDNDVILVVTKRDLLPKSINNEKLIQYIEKINKTKNILNTIIISNFNNEGLDELYQSIMYAKNSNKVYVVGNTNAGKSTLTNKLVKNYSTNTSDLTTSILPSTTLSTINVKLNDELTLIDTPGLIDESSIINNIDIKNLKQITPKKEIKPITFQLNKNKSIECDTYFKLNYINGNKNSFTCYFSNNLKIKQYNIKTHMDKYQNFESHILELTGNEDIVINGLGFIKITKPGTIELYSIPNVSVIKRESMI